jgi:membrane protein implicated in regulation of membrane protease activity
VSDLVLLHEQYGVWAWAGLAGALLAVEAMTGSGWLLWPAASAAVVAIAVKALGLGLEAAVLTFVVLTILTTLLARRFLPYSPFERGGHDINDATARLLGHHGRAVAAFRGRRGRVFIDGKEWAAELDEGEAVEAGADVEVTGVAGARLRVKIG